MSASIDQRSGRSDNGTLLVVEDNPAHVRLVEEAIAEFHLPVTIRTGATGEATMTALTRPDAGAHPDLVLLDWHLADGTGRDVLAEVRASDCTDRPVVVFTSPDDEEQISEASRLGADAYIVKPTDLDAFMETIDATVRIWLSPSDGDGKRGGRRESPARRRD